MKQPLLDRFNSRWTPEPNTGCWLWTSYWNGKYPQIWFGRKKEYAHHVSWRLFHGKIPDGLNVLHRCDTPMCVNPDHLFVGTQSENLADCFAKGRANPFLNGQHGEDNPRCKLTKEKVLAIRSDTRSRREISKEYQISLTQIGAIKLRQCWRNL